MIRSREFYLQVLPVGGSQLYQGEESVAFLPSPINDRDDRERYAPKVFRSRFELRRDWIDEPAPGLPQRPHFYCFSNNGNFGCLLLPGGEAFAFGRKM